MKNLMPEVAKLLGVEIGEEFKLSNISNEHITFKLTTKGLLHKWDGEKEWENNVIGFKQLLLGEAEIIKLPFKPKCGEKYYDVASTSISCMYWCDSMIDYSSYKLGNCFRTREDAELNADRIRKEIMDYER